MPTDFTKFLAGAEAVTGGERWGFGMRGGAGGHDHWATFVLGGGGPMPQGLTQWSNGLLANLFAGKPGAADPALQAALLAAQTELAKNVLGQSLSLGLPARAGDPLLANLAVVIRVADADRHLQLL